ncbi:hypothetical protein [Paenibacillus sp. NAIST15-1]|uniref:hypothetical protein n=1 Tax=Paenibacillus sp. NAIST15-1 TaxID=1605994 RepID=UPI000A9A7855|nr:hypothetical protein [Paenibacillus sp. NAIST15-1]
MQNKSYNQDAASDKSHWQFTLANNASGILLMVPTDELWNMWKWYSEKIGIATE